MFIEHLYRSFKIMILQDTDDGLWYSVANPGDLRSADYCPGGDDTYNDCLETTKEYIDQISDTQ